MQNKLNTLHNIQILVTRPAHQAATICQLIAQQGGHAILLPTITIEFIDSAQQPSLISQLEQLAKQNIAIFISVNAVQAVAELMQKYKIKWPESLMIAAVGASTARALKELKWPITFMPAQFNSEALLASPQLQNVKGRYIIIFRGEGGRELLATVLRERGAALTEAIVYRRVLPVIDLQSLLPHWQAGGLDIIICTSNTGLQNLITMLGESAHNWLLNMPLVVISERMAQYAKELGFVKKPIVADNATDAAIIQALLNYYSDMSA